MSEGRCLICLGRRGDAVPGFAVSFRGEERLPPKWITKGGVRKLRQARAPVRFEMQGILCQPCCNSVFKGFKGTFGKSRFRVQPLPRDET